MNKSLFTIFILTQVWAFSPDQANDEEKTVRSDEEITDFSTEKTGNEKRTHLHSNKDENENENEIETEVKDERKVVIEEQTYQHANEDEDQNGTDKNENDVEMEIEDEDKDHNWTISNMTPDLTREEKTGQQLKEIINPSDPKIFHEENIVSHENENELVYHRKVVIQEQTYLRSNQDEVANAWGNPNENEEMKIEDDGKGNGVEEEQTHLRSNEVEVENGEKNVNENEEMNIEDEGKDQMLTLNNVTPDLTREENVAQLNEITNPSDPKILEEEKIALHKDENELSDRERTVIKQQTSYSNKDEVENRKENENENEKKMEDKGKSEANVVVEEQTHLRSNEDEVENEEKNVNENEEMNIEDEGKDEAVIETQTNVHSNDDENDNEKENRDENVDKMEIQDEGKGKQVIQQQTYRHSNDDEDENENENDAEIRIDDEGRDKLSTISNMVPYLTLEEKSGQRTEEIINSSPSNVFEQESIALHKDETELIDRRETVIDEHTHLHSNEAEDENKKENENEKEDQMEIEHEDKSDGKTAPEEHTYLQSHEDEDENRKENEDENRNEIEIEDEVNDNDQLRIINNTKQILTNEEKIRLQLMDIINPTEAKICEEEYIALHRDEDGLINRVRYTEWPILEGGNVEELSAVCAKFLNIIPLTSKLEFEEIIYLHINVQIIMVVRILRCQLEQYTYYLLESNNDNCVYVARKLINTTTIFIKSKICETENPTNNINVVQNAKGKISNMLPGLNIESEQVPNFKQNTGMKKMKRKEGEIGNAEAAKEKSMHYSTANHSNQNLVISKQFKPLDIDGLHGNKYKPLVDLYK